jgi:predicted RND superfamily exporter protein
MVMTIRPEVRRIASLRTMIEQVVAILKKHPLPKGYRYHLSGLPAIRVKIVEQMQREQARLIPVFALWFVFVLMIIYRQRRTAIVPLLAVGMGLIWLLGLLSALDQPFNLISNVLPLLLLVIGVSNSVHVINRYIEEVRRNSADRRRAAYTTISKMSVACLLASLTTAIGFLSIAVARSEAVRAFGWQTALGMLLLYVSTMRVLGLALPWLRERKTSGSTAELVKVASSFV